MINLIRSEWVKFRSVRSTVVLVAIAAVLVIGIALASANQVRGDVEAGQCERTVMTDTGDSYKETTSCTTVEGQDGWEPSAANLGDLTAGVSLAAMLFGAFGVQIIGQEYRFNTIRPTFTAAPNRTRVMVAKAALLAMAIGVASAVMLAICALIGTAMLDPFTVDSADRGVVLGIVAFSVLWSLLGMGVGMILRQPIAGMIILFVEALIIESIVSALFDWSRPWLPFTNGLQMTIRDIGPTSDFRPPLEGGIYLAAVAAVVWAVGAVLVSKRDA